MQQYLYLLLFLACPVAMFFMMRGMHGGKGAGHDMSAMPGHDMSSMQANDDAKDLRLADLEREVAELRAASNEQRFIESRGTR